MLFRSVEVLFKNGRGVRNATLTPEGGVEGFRNPFLIMMQEADKDRPDVKFSMFDARTGGVARFEARVVRKFKKALGTRTYEGRTLEARGPDGTFMLHITNDGMLFQIDLPNGDKAYALQFPVEGVKPPR